MALDLTLQHTWILAAELPEILQIIQSDLKFPA